MTPSDSRPVGALAQRTAEQFAQGRWYELLAVVAGGEVAPVVGTALVAYSADKLKGMRILVDALSDPEDEPELYRQLVFHWLELRCEWTRYNQVMQYQSVRQGMVDPEVFLRGGLSSALVGWIEPLLDPQDVMALVDIAADPLGFARRSTSRPPTEVRFEPMAKVDHRVVWWLIDSRLREAAARAGKVAVLVQGDAGLGEVDLRYVERLDGATRHFVDWLIAEAPIGHAVEVSLNWHVVEGGLVVSATANLPADAGSSPPIGWFGNAGRWHWTSASALAA